MLEYWFLLPVGIVLGSVAMSSGVSGSNFWIPIYLLWLGLEPRVAFWVSLSTTLFGFGSGVIRNYRAGTIDWSAVRRYGALAVPATAVAAALSARVPQRGLLIAFALFVVVFGLFLLVEFSREQRGGEERRHSGVRWPVALVAGALHGAIATGSGTVLTPTLVGDRRLDHHATAVGSTIVVVFLCSLVAVVFRIEAQLLDTLEARWEQIVAMIAFAGPGAAIGGQLGPRIAQRIPRRYLRLYLGLLLLGVGGFIVTRAL